MIKLRDLASDTVLKTFELLDDSSIFNKIHEKITLLCPIFPDFRKGGSEHVPLGHTN
jgi:hypothetical protein